MRNVTILLAVVAVLAMATSAQAGTISYEWLTDANTGPLGGVSTSKTYTTIVDLGSGSVATINGVTFDSLATASNFQMTTGSGYLAESINTSLASWITSGWVKGIANPGGVYDLAYDLIQVQGSSPPFVETITLSGLTSDTDYVTTLYPSAYGPVYFTVGFDNGNDGSVEDVTPEIYGYAPPLTGNDGHQPYMIQYAFTATGTEMAVIIGTRNDTYGLKMSGVTNEVVPEPATMVLLGLGGIGVLIRRRRK